MSISSAEWAFTEGSERMKRGEWAEAAQAFQEAERLGYRSALLPPYLGEALVRSGQIEAATKAYEEAAAQDNWYIGGDVGTAYMRCFLGLCLWRGGRHEEALTQLSEALRVKPRLVEAQAGLALVLNALGKIEESVAAFQRTLALMPSYLEHWPVAFEGAFFYQIEIARAVYAAVSRGERWKG